MKKILISIRPKWVEKIASGEKTIVVHKSAPQEAPFKAYIYETKESKMRYLNDRFNSFFSGKSCYTDMGKVIGEFVCNKTERFSVGSLRSDDIEKLACLSYNEMISYFYKTEELDGKTVKQGFAWHISDLKIYDKPKELSEFSKPCPIDTRNCENCITYGKPYTWDFDEKTEKIFCTRRLTHPPQSWQYVEEL